MFQVSSIFLRRRHSVFFYRLPFVRGWARFFFPNGGLPSEHLLCQGSSRCVCSRNFNLSSESARVSLSSRSRLRRYFPPPRNGSHSDVTMWPSFVFPFPPLGVRPPTVHCSFLLVACLFWHHFGFCFSFFSCGILTLFLKPQGLNVLRGSADHVCPSKLIRAFLSTLRLFFT